MSRSHLPPEQYAKAAASWTPEFFGIRIQDCDDVDRLRAAAEYEAERDGETRPDRIARINQRIARLQE